MDQKVCIAIKLSCHCLICCGAANARVVWKVYYIWGSYCVVCLAKFENIMTTCFVVSEATFLPHFHIILFILGIVWISILPIFLFAQLFHTTSRYKRQQRGECLGAVGSGWYALHTESFASYISSMASSLLTQRISQQVSSVVPSLLIQCISLQVSPYLR
jgi:hypothetical protein